jgi:ribonucleoside-diphosphate reductase alpha chain
LVDVPHQLAPHQALSDNALRVLRARYLRGDSSGEVVESPEELLWRVGRSVARAKYEFFSEGAAGEWEDAFIEAMAGLDLLPNSSCLLNSGKPLGMLSACFVLPVEDSIRTRSSTRLADGPDPAGRRRLRLFLRAAPGREETGWFPRATRPRRDRVSFMGIFDCATENIKQGGRGITVYRYGSTGEQVD